MSTPTWANSYIPTSTGRNQTNFGHEVFPFPSKTHLLIIHCARASHFSFHLRQRNRRKTKSLVYTRIVLSFRISVRSIVDPKISGHHYLRAQVCDTFFSYSTYELRPEHLETAPYTDRVVVIVSEMGAKKTLSSPHKAIPQNLKKNLTLSLEFGVRKKNQIRILLR